MASSGSVVMVVRQATFNSAVLMNPVTGQLVEGGGNIPLEQILAGPRRSLLHFEPADGDRSIGQMLRKEGEDGLPVEVKAMGWKPGKKTGWKGLTRGQVVAYRPDASRKLAIGYILFNDEAQMSVEVHTCRSAWTDIVVTHRKEYR